MKRMFACALLILVAPIITAWLQPGVQSNAPIASIALAGHTLSGGYCRCGSPGCICDPGESNEINVQQPAADVAPVQSSGPDVSAMALFLGTTLFMLRRLWR